MPRAAPEKLDLADRLEIDIRTLRNWEKKDGFPEGGTYEEVVAWRDLHGLGQRGNKDIAAVKLEIATQQLLKITRENEIAHGKYVTIEDFVESATRATSIWQTRMRGILETEMPPRLLGLGIAEMRAEIRTIVDELCADVAAELKKCAKTQP